MGKGKNGFWSDFILAGALTAAAVYAFVRIRDAPIPDKPVVVEMPRIQEAKVEVSEPKKLEQIVVDEKTGLSVVQPRDSFQFYGERVLQGGKYRHLDRDLYGLLSSMADAYKTEFSQKLFVGPMWDDKGHTSNSKHYKGLAVDIDFGADVGTEQYNKADRKKAEFLLRYVKTYSQEHNKDFKVLFNDKDFINEGLCAYFEGHNNHIHVSK